MRLVEYNVAVCKSLLEKPLLRWGGAFIFVVGAHISAVFVALNWHTGKLLVEPVEPMAAMMIDLAPMPVAPEMSPNNAPFGLVQEEILLPPSEPVPEIEPLLELPVVKDAEAVLLPKPEIIEEEPEPIEEVSEAQEDKAPPSIEAPLDDIAAAPMEGAVSLEPSQASATWQSILLRHLENHKRYPRKARIVQQE